MTSSTDVVPWTPEVHPGKELVPAERPQSPAWTKLVILLGLSALVVFLAAIAIVSMAH